MGKKIELIPGTRVTIETKDDGSTITIYEKETPSYQFKDGDFVRSNDYGTTFYYIYRGLQNNSVETYAIYGPLTDGILQYDGTLLGSKSMQQDARLLNEKEKQQVIDALRKDGKKWDAENKKIVSIQPEFKVGDVVRYETKNGWSDQYLIAGLALELVESLFYKDELYNPICGKVSFRSGSLNLKLEDSIGTDSFYELMKEKGVKFDKENGKIEKVRWQPKHGEDYYYIRSYGGISEDVYIEYCESDKTRLSIGNFFKTKEQAEAAAERIKKLFAEIQAELYK